LNRREQILNELIKTFKQRGFNSDFTMSELAEKVNIGKSTIYEYFGNKDDIIKAAILEYVHKSIQTVDVSEETKDMNFEDSFKRQLDVLLSVASESRYLLDALAPGFVQKLPESMKEEMKQMVEKTRDRIQERFTSFFIKGIAEGVIRNDNMMNKGYVVTSLVIGTIITFSGRQVPLAKEVVIEDVYQAILTLLN